MKKIAILASGKGTNFEAIVNYFKDKDVKIICLSDNLNAPVLEKAQKLGVEHKYLPHEQNAEYFCTHTFDLIVLAGYMRILQPEVIETGTFINVHPSLLPSFKGKDAIQRTFMSGVKVSGVTIHYVTQDLDSGKIIAQYPVLIHTLMHFDEFEYEIHKVEHMLYPIVIEKLLNDEVFDFDDLIGNCSGGCKGDCGGCH